MPRVGDFSHVFRTRIRRDFALPPAPARPTRGTAASNFSQEPHDFRPVVDHTLGAAMVILFFTEL